LVKADVIPNLILCVSSYKKETTTNISFKSQLFLLDQPFSTGFASAYCTKYVYGAKATKLFS